MKCRSDMPRKSPQIGLGRARAGKGPQLCPTHPSRKINRKQIDWKGPSEAIKHEAAAATNNPSLWSFPCPL